MRKGLMAIVLAVFLGAFFVGCGTAEPQIITKEVVVEKEVIKEVPKEIVVTKEVIKEVPKEIVVTKETIREVPVETIKEVVVEKEVVKIEQIQVPVDRIVVETKIVEVEKVFSGYGEAPQLTQQVQGGVLPAIEDRLPTQPMVIPTFGSTGSYGGSIRRFYLGPGDGCNFFRLSRASLVRFSTDGFSYVPSVARGWEVNDDGTEWTFFLRKGMKWSDGDDFNADDFMYQYNDVILNTDLTPKPPSFLASLDEYGSMSKVDDTTIKFTFPNPNFMFLEIVAQADEACYGSTRNVTFAPSHYLKEFHIDYNPDANELAKAAGFDDWTQLYDDRISYNNNPDKPAVSPWHFTNRLGDAVVRAERNPYFWGVDPDGNQLPYIDNIVLTLVESPSVGTLKAVQGEIDLQGRHIQLPDFPVLKEGEEKGGYDIVTWPTFGGSDVAFFPNMSYPGATGDAMRKAEVRQAMSLAIDRDAINDISFLGLGTPRQNVPKPGHAHYPGDDVAQQRVPQDVDAAIALLDAVTEKDGDGNRTIGGEKIVISIGVTPAFGPWPDVAEQVAGYWNDVGLATDVQVMTRSLVTTKRINNEFAVFVWNEDSTGFTFTNIAKRSIAFGDAGCFPGPAFCDFVRTEGAEGTDPASVGMQELSDWSFQHLIGPTIPKAEHDALAKELYTQLVQEQYNIGIVGLSPMVQGVIVKKKTLRNVPDTAGNDWPLRTPNTGFPEQWYYSK